jgi:MFS transporter, YNFM family, putative membrane transport protein
MLHNTLQTHATQMAPQARGTAVALFAVALFFGQSAGVLLAARVIETAGPAWLFAIAAVALLATGIGFSQALHRRHLRFSNP